MPYVYPTWHAHDRGLSGQSDRACAWSGVISFIGAGPGAADLLTMRAVDRLARADIVLWAGSLVSAEVLGHCQADATLLDTKGMTLEDITAVYAAHPDATIARLHSRDPAWYSAVGEQIAWCLSNALD
jgi:precorrin-4/cobalt-precorrin-4 C11-methyltransferase